MNVTNAPTPIYIEGIEYEVNPVALEDLEYLDNYSRSRAIEAARMALPDNCSAEQERRAMLPAHEAANKLSMFTGGGLDKLLDPLFAARLMTRIVRKPTKDGYERPSPTDCFRWMVNPAIRNEVMPKLMDSFMRTMGLEPKEEKAADEPRPSQTGTKPASTNGSPSPALETQAS